jgi:chemotaxis protein CheX
MQFAESEICQIMQTIWSSMLSLDAEPVEWNGSTEGKERVLIGCIPITGAWEGAVTFDCSEALARRLAATMMRLDAATIASEDVQDALGEMTNIIGGNVKRLLPYPSRLSLPTVADGLDYSLKVAGSHPVSEVAFRCEGEPMRVRLLERDECAVKVSPGYRPSGR